MRVFLIGFMGSGKSTLGFPLARRLGLRFVDLDRHIEQSEGQTIPDIFAAEGEQSFREMENRHLREYIEANDDFVMSTGGGTPCFNDNIDLMNSTGRTVYLKLEPEMLAARLKNSKTVRPLVAGKTSEELLEYIKTTLADREKYYDRASVVIADPTRDVSRLAAILEYR